MPLFSSTFLLFIVLVTIIYFLVPKTYQWICLLVSSYAFYLYGGGYKTVIYILVTTLTVFFGARAIERAEEKKRKKTILLLVLLLNIGILAV